MPKPDKINASVDNLNNPMDQGRSSLDLPTKARSRFSQNPAATTQPSTQLSKSTQAQPNQSKPTPSPSKTAQIGRQPITKQAHQTSSTPMTKDTPSPSWCRRHKRNLSIVGGALGLILLLLALMVGYTFAVANQLKTQVSQAEQISRSAFSQFKAQDLTETKSDLDKLELKLAQIDQTYRKLAFYKVIPLARGYYFDGEHGLNAARAGLAAGQKSINAIEPYADVLGFAGEGSFTGGSAENRLKLIIETIDKVMPEIDSIAQDLETAQAELAMINPDRYPEEIQGVAARSLVIKAQDVTAGAVTALTEYRPVLEQLPRIAGGKGQRQKYLILFQNDNELRPTGGFLTAYAIIFVEDGVVTPEKSDDIYELDKKFRQTEPIPKELGRYLTTEKYWNLRDMNIDPDFKKSMDKFFPTYSSVPGEPDDVSGVIAIDTEFVTALLKILGPVNIDGFGTFSAENDPSCDCPQIINVLSQIITRPTPYLRENRKGIIGPLMRGMLTKAYDAPRQQWPDLFTQFFSDIKGRHVQFYFVDEQMQQAAEALGGAGRMFPPENGDDFFAVVNANLGGAKSNLYVTYQVTQEVSQPQDGFITKQVEISYKNPRRADNCDLEAGLLCLNSTLRDWTRIYLPKNSELIKATGFTDQASTDVQNGFLVVDGFFILEPKGTAKIKLSYKVPYQDTQDYRLKIWKQGGIAQYPLLMVVNGNEEELSVDKDIEYQTSF